MPLASSSITPGELGVVYHTMKFCDYYGFEYAEATLDGGIPMVKIETDGTSQSAGQLKTRLAAFGETLRGVSRARDAAEAKRAHTGDKPLYVLGIDSGSTSTDAVILDSEKNLVATVIVPTGAKATEAAARAKEQGTFPGGTHARRHCAGSLNRIWQRSHSWRRYLNH
ncbi:MAG: 2-hydroxyacyl-CoA dehydratase [Atopobiaceae bacterium]